MKAIGYTLVALLAVWSATEAAAQDYYGNPKSETGTHSDLEVGIGNGKETTFNKFLNENWDKVRVPDPRLKEKKALREKVRKKRESKYGPSEGSGKRIGGAPRMKGGYKHTRRGGFDRERDERLKEEAMLKADKDHEMIRDLHGAVQGAISRDAAFQASTDGAMMAKAAKEAYSGQPEAASGPKADVLGDIVDFSKPQYDYEELLRRFAANPDSLTRDEYDFLSRKMDEEISSLEESEYNALKEEVENSKN